MLALGIQFVDSLGCCVALGSQIPHARAQGGLDHLQIIDGAPQAAEFLLVNPGSSG